MTGAALEFGLLRYPTSYNLGDEIQSLAARRWLPRVDRMVSREDLDSERAAEGGRLAMILNGWFMHRPEHWPPHDSIVPLLTSMHFDDTPPEGRFGRWRASTADIMTRREGIAYLRRHQPIGARDHATLLRLRRRGIDAYYSGCLTLTLKRNPSVARAGYVVATDLGPAQLTALQARSLAPVRIVTHHDLTTHDPVERLERAQDLLDLYAGAKAVVTSRLHCALPCLALETPVLLVPQMLPVARLQPGLELAHHCTAEDFTTGRVGFDVNDPPKNPDSYRALRKALGERCRAFIESLT